MRRTLWICALLVCSGFSAMAEPVDSPLTLKHAYESALKQSEKIAIEREDIEKARARFYRSFTYFLPTVDYEISRTEKDAISSLSSDGVSGDAARRVTPEAKFTFSQPIFSGFKEYAALAATGADKKAQRLDYERAQELLFIDVMDAYYNALEAERDRDVLKATHTLVLDRLKELKERVELGRSRESEMKVSESDLKVLEADLVNADNRLKLARNLLSFYIGRDLGDVALDDGAFPNEEPPAPPERLKRKDVMAAEQEAVVADKAVIAAQSGFFPKVTLDGNYYTRRVGYQSGNDWDFVLKADVPIFDAGQTLGDVKEAAASREAAKLRRDEARRSSVLDAQNAYENLLSSRRAEEALTAADSASKENYDILTQEYRLNLVSNLDVLDALRRYQDVRRRANQARYQTIRNRWKYKVALGEPVP